MFSHKEQTMAKLLLGGKIYTIVREFLYCISILNMV